MTFDPDVCPKSLIIAGHDPSTKPGKHCGWHQRYRLGRGNE